MKWYLGKSPVFKLGSIIYWKGVKYKVTSTKQCNLESSDKPLTTIGVKVINNKSV